MLYFFKKEVKLKKKQLNVIIYNIQLFVPVEVIAAQMVTSTSLENLFYLLCELLKQNFDLDTTKTLILHVWSIFFNGVHLTKLWSKQIFFMKTLSKLGALTVQITVWGKISEI
jgi:hypothetical protein